MKTADRMSEERLEIIEKGAHRTGNQVLIEVCREVRRLQARVAALAAFVRSKEARLVSLPIDERRP